MAKNAKRQFRFSHVSAWKQPTSQTMDEQIERRERQQAAARSRRRRIDDISVAERLEDGFAMLQGGIRSIP